MKFLCRVFDRGLYIQSNVWEIIVESICNFKRACNCFIIIRYGRRRRMWYSFKWNYIFNTFPSTLLRLSLKNFVKWEHLLFFSNVDIRFLYYIHFKWISFFWLISFDFINFANKLFSVEIGFCKPKVIHGLDLNLSFFFVTFLRDEWLSKTALMLFKKLLKERFTSLSSLITEFQSTEK